jgi:P-type Cu2+ transporter
METTKRTFPVTGMTCSSCAVSVESMLKAQKGVIIASVNFAASTAFVEYDPRLADLNDFKNAIKSIGYDILIDDDNAEKKNDIEKKQYKTLKINTLLSLLLSLPTVIIAMLFMDMPFANLIMLLLSAPVLFWFGRMFFVNAYKKARHFKANMDSLVALSTGIAFVLSIFNTLFPEFWHQRGLHPHVYFETASVIVSLILLGKLLEERAKSNTSSAIKKLIGLQPKSVTVIKEEGIEVEVPVAQVKIDDIILVKPGDKIPVDGEIVNGNSFIDESTITGESLPAERIKGDKVFAGTINQKGSFRFIAKKVGNETILAQIIKMVQEAQGSKAPVQKLVDKVAGIFVPVVIIVSIVSFLTWIFFGGDNAITHALLAMVTVLVIACPCALGLATPTAIMVGIGKGAEKGILIKDAENLEVAHKINSVILDKTGTITEGKPEVTDFVWYVEEEEQISLKQILFALESASEHPLADAVKAELKSENIPHQPLEKFESKPGLGVTASLMGIEYNVGNKKLMELKNIGFSADVLLKTADLENKANTVIYFSGADKLYTVIAISDKIKETSIKAVKKLQQQNIEVYMLTGDNKQTAKAVADKVGIKNYKAEVMPSDKADFIKELQSNGKIVAMVGDGINDSHALAQADISIAMGKGSDIAIDVAKMTIISSDLRLIPEAIKLSRLTVQTIGQNLFWAFIYNLIGIPIAAGLLYPLWGFLLNPMLAGAAMAFSSVSVVSNSLRLKSKTL